MVVSGAVVEVLRPTSVYLPERAKVELREKARREHRSFGGEVRRAVELYLRSESVSQGAGA